MIKKTDGYLLTSSVNHKYIVKIRLSFHQRQLTCSTIQNECKEVLILTFTYCMIDLSSNKSPEHISLDILNLAQISEIKQ